MSYVAAFLAISIRCWYSFLVPEEEMEGYQHAMAKPTLLPDPTCLHLQLLDASETTIIPVVTTTSEEAACPLCHRSSASIHSRYTRAVADLPWMGCAVRLVLDMSRCLKLLHSFTHFSVPLLPIPHYPVSHSNAPSLAIAEMIADTAQ
jgi:hypothetical protein